MNTLSALDQGVLTMLGELSNPKERDARRHELAVGTGDFSDSAKLKLADALLEHYRWSELKDMDLVPRWAAVRERIEDPEPVLDEFAYSSEPREIFPDDPTNNIRHH